MKFSAYSGQISSPCNNKVHSDSHTLLQEKQSEVASIQLLTMNNTIIFVHMIGENPVLLPSCDKPPDLTPAGQKTKPNRESLKKKKKKKTEEEEAEETHPEQEKESAPLSSAEHRRK